MDFFLKPKEEVDNMLAESHFNLSQSTFRAGIYQYLDTKKV